MYTLIMDNKKYEIKRFCDANEMSIFSDMATFQAIKSFIRKLTGEYSNKSALRRHAADLLYIYDKCLIRDNELIERLARSIQRGQLKIIDVSQSGRKNGYSGELKGIDDPSSSSEDTICYKRNYLSPTQPKNGNAVKEAPILNKTPIAVFDPAPINEKAWIEVCLLDDMNQPFSEEMVVVTGPDGKTFSCVTNAEGMVRLDGIEPGSYKISFPKLDNEYWS